MASDRIEIAASCCCHIGKVRTNNEDNFYFNGSILDNGEQQINPYETSRTLVGAEPVCFSVFDGMGGEEAGEVAAYTAAATIRSELEKYSERKDNLMPMRRIIGGIYEKINFNVCEKSRALKSGRMGSTGVSLFFSHDEVYACNVGDSRAYRYRNGRLMQISREHVERVPNWENRKPRLIQYLGMFPEELTFLPYITKGKVQKGDIFLLCSDGLTDMVSNDELCAILKRPTLTRCGTVKKLLKRALDNGGIDNITIICCKVR